MQRIILGTLITSLVGCSTQMGHQSPVAIKQALNQAANDAVSRPAFELPAAVNADLMPALDSSYFSSPQAREKRFRVNARNVDANAFFSSLVQGTPFNIVIHPNVSGLISLQLKDVTLDDVLDVVDDVYGYSTTRKGNIIQVFPATLRTDIIPVDYLHLQRQGVSLTSITTGSITNTNNSTSANDEVNVSEDVSTTTGGTTIKTSSESDFWQQLEKVVRGMIGHGEGRNVMISPQAGLISVRAFPNELREVKQFLGISQQRLVRQVVLEAKIMEVTLNDSYQQGINWQNITRSIGGTNIAIGSTPIVNTAAIAALPGGNAISDLLGGQTNITISDGNFTSVLSFLETQGDLNVLSSPRVTAANNQKAVIKVGGDEYFVTNVSSSNVSGDNSTAAPDIELTPFFSGISLDVTPQIDDQGGVLLHVHPTVVDIKNEIKAVDLGEKFGVYQLPLAKSTIRESDSIIHARSGDVVVIGGLMKTVMTDQVSKVPLLGDIPLVGNLFRNINKVKQKTELVILLKPTVISDQTWQKEIERSRALVDEWFPEDK
ncbi:pilus (MSHA type) biogenesis protein MshL [Photobacterium phosphoreum]|uniref:Pilus (MSHA type) biogenesis protein MshL n=1 Tax=Photobacterium phosphoreum TaxID=659 RepID=A0AAW5A3Z2_PHOPO|nr:pilus (MSHA type) biogenesis protein MshL [Photobacterium phosphoreum]MCD9484233.1 pilus (MSHA type) biogenesis protein MshL [Photobacterium phosphoreum]MCD9492434.1 pilus (MSHA type) biogenesis protein MshL [Photobacterium phosphoreum]MCF2191653.1 pilus (MSHA type) biogenesis protein MshL [Photobacterium phosphoreum]MCF2303296.1 pilus (MSHA type) biogenesis protein MshL [Photobacterium phosphoreum]PSW31658.1 pilus (MSHA type) biogenesis protein MshL [Photobacterium phosphoreum]